MKKTLLITTIFISTFVNANIIRIYDSHLQTDIKYQDLIKATSNSTFVVLGEFHNDIIIQKAEAQLISDTISFSKKDASIMWEFLNFTEQNEINIVYNKFLNNQLTVEDLINQTVGMQNITYSEILNIAKMHKTKLIGLNLPRDLKQKVILGGLSAIDSKLIPPEHYLGGKNYYDRFFTTMGGHVPEEKIKAYYLAQCLTDSVMAYHSILNKTDINFIIGGSFHTDFYDGAVDKLQKLTNEPIATLKIVNDDNLDGAERKLYTEGDPHFGEFANYIIFTSEK